MNPFGWILISFPVYLFVRGKFVDYVKLAGSAQTSGTAK